MSREEAKGSIVIKKIHTGKQSGANEALSKLEKELGDEKWKERARQRDEVWYCSRCNIFVSIDQLTCPVCGGKEE